MTTAMQTSKLPSVPNTPTKTLVDMRAMLCPWAMKHLSMERLEDRLIEYSEKLSIVPQIQLIIQWLSNHSAFTLTNKTGVENEKHTVFILRSVLLPAWYR